MDTQWGQGEWWDEEGLFFFVDFFGGGISFDIRRVHPRICESVHWYSYSVSSKPNFVRAELPFGVSWNMSPEEVQNKLGAPSKHLVGIDSIQYSYPDLCEYETSLLWSKGELYNLSIGIDAFQPVENEKRTSWLSRIWCL